MSKKFQHKKKLKKRKPQRVAELCFNVNEASDSDQRNQLCCAQESLLYSALTVASCKSHVAAVQPAHSAAAPLTPSTQNEYKWIHKASNQHPSYVICSARVSYSLSHNFRSLCYSLQHTPRLTISTHVIALYNILKLSPIFTVQRIRILEYSTPS